MIGHEMAVRLYQAFLTDLAQRFAGQSFDLYWAFTPAKADFHAFITTLVPSFALRMQCFPQEGADLNARLLNAFKWTYARHFERTIVISSDSPQLSWETAMSARAALDEADVVLGPADDGGYYLIAMRKPFDVFSGIPMSTSMVTRMTIALAEHQNLSVRLLDPLFDIDELPDLLRLIKLLEADRTLAPITAAHLASIRHLPILSMSPRDWPWAQTG
jgi:rSAM/selenodomain-associated transferase 1